MSTDLLVLLGVGLLAFVQQMLPGLGFVQKAGLAWGAGNRDAPPKRDPWAERAARAHANLMENLPHFIILVLVAHITHQADALTATACLVFLGARIAHAALYVAGITHVRTVAFYAGVGAEFAIAYAILS